MMNRQMRTSFRAPSGMTLVAVLLVGAVWGPGTAGADSNADHPVPTYQVPRGPGKSAVSLNVDNAPIRAVLRLLFRRANQSYVLGSHVTGTVTASFRNVPFDTALNQIVSANSVPLTKTLVNGIYVIKGPAQTTRSRARRGLVPFHGRSRVR